MQQKVNRITMLPFQLAVLWSKVYDRAITKYFHIKSGVYWTNILKLILRSAKKSSLVAFPNDCVVGLENVIKHFSIHPLCKITEHFMFIKTSVKKVSNNIIYLFIHKSMRYTVQDFRCEKGSKYHIISIPYPPPLVKYS